MFISLRPSTYIMGVKCQPGVFWGHRGQKVIFSKNATSATEYIALSPLCNIVYPCYSYICISLKPFITFMGSRSICGVISAGRVCRLCRQRCLVLSFFFLSGNTPFSHTSLHPIQTKLGQSDQYLDHYSGSNDDGVRGYDGVTGVKMVIFTKKASSPTECVALTRDLCIWISLTPSTKVITLKIHPESLGVTGVKRSFSPKRHQILQNT